MGTLRLTHGGRVTAVAISPDGKTIETVVFSPDGRLLAASGNEHPKAGDFGNRNGQPQTKTQSIVMWDPVTGKVLRRFGNHLATVKVLAFAPDSTILASGAYFSGIGDAVLAEKEDSVRLWDPASGKELLRILGKFETVNALAFTGDAKMLAVGSNFPAVQIWDVATGKLRLELPGHRHGITALALSPDGQRLASASYDGTILVWDVEKLRPPAKK